MNELDISIRKLTKASRDLKRLSSKLKNNADLSFSCEELELIKRVFESVSHLTSSTDKENIKSVIDKIKSFGL